MAKRRKVALVPYTVRVTAAVSRQIEAEARRMKVSGTRLATEILTARFTFQVNQ